MKVTPTYKIYSAVRVAMSQYRDDEKKQMLFARIAFASLRPGSKIKTVDGDFTVRKEGLFQRDNGQSRYQYDVVFRAVKKSLDIVDRTLKSVRG